MDWETQKEEPFNLHPSHFFLLGNDQMTTMWSMEPWWAALTPPLPPPSTPWSLKGLHMFMAHACGMTMDSPYKSQEDHGVFQLLLFEDSCWQNDSSHIYFGQTVGTLSGKLIRDPTHVPLAPPHYHAGSNEESSGSGSVTTGNDSLQQRKISQDI